MKRSDGLYIVLIVFAWPSLLAGCSVDHSSTVHTAAPEPASRESPEFTDCLARHLTTHPVATARDVYKFVHQSVAGPGHLIPSKDTALAYLQREIANLEEAPQHEPLYEELGGELDLVRLNLRPYMKRGGDLRRLVEAVQITADSVYLNEEEMSRRLTIAASLLSTRGLHQESDALVSMLNEFAGRGYPALHHSDTYRAAYRPAYRLVSRDQADVLACSLPYEDPP